MQISYVVFPVSVRTKVGTINGIDQDSVGPVLPWENQAGQALEINA